jgi:hypothetical protein
MEGEKGGGEWLKYKEKGERMEERVVEGSWSQYLSYHNILRICIHENLKCESNIS